ncbi:MAG: hypothetical protein IJ071_06875 [Ruminococcus sp.]|nr:hypothetical protein [Ruminococcus sp.]
MKKSVYSLVLMDDVVRAVDAQAGRLGTSRSNLINQILAEHLSCVTPEMRMKAIFGQVQRLIDTTFQVQQQSPSAMTFRGSLQYKYHPTISYRVELDRAPERFLGKLSVSIRTQNQKLIRECTEFFRYRCEMEARYLARLGYTDYTAGIGPGTFTRALFNSGELDEEGAAEAIYSYISDLDRSLMLWLADVGAFVQSQAELEADYREMLGKYVV